MPVESEYNKSLRKNLKTIIVLKYWNQKLSVAPAVEDTVLQVKNHRPLRGWSLAQGFQTRESGVNLFNPQN